MGKNLNRWIGAYITQEVKSIFKEKIKTGPVHIMFACVDHYEPDWGKANLQTQKNRVKRWVREYPELVTKHKDSDGQHPKHSFFYPAECYVKENLELLEGLCHKGYGEVDIHLHHEDDTEENLLAQLEKAKKDFLSHGFLGQRKLSGQLHYAFIHGNWCLNNSRSDGRWCGVNDESRILKETGCYADFTFPSAPSETQPKKINSIYYTRSSSQKPKTHNKGIRVKVGKHQQSDLMLICGPLTLNWKRRKAGIFPRIENAEIAGVNPPTPDRVDLWVNQHISVEGKEDWIFIKVHTHGAVEKNSEVLLGAPMDQMYSDFETRYNDGQNYCLHYVTAREMYNIVKAAEAGETGNPHEYRDYLIERRFK